MASHGLLHLLGWDHPDEDSLAAMLECQDRLLGLGPPMAVTFDPMDRNRTPATPEAMPTESPMTIEEEATAISAAARRRSWRIAGDLPASFRYAAQGLGYATVSQRNFRIHLATAAVVFCLATVLQLDLTRMAVLVLTVAAVLVLELLNTAIEAVVDLGIGRRYHPPGANCQRLRRCRRPRGRHQLIADRPLPAAAPLLLRLNSLPNLPMLLVIDNYDSFTFNLVQYFGELAAQHPLAADLQVHRNDALNLEQIASSGSRRDPAVSGSRGPRPVRRLPRCAAGTVANGAHPGRLSRPSGHRPRCTAAGWCAPPNRCTARPHPCCIRGRGFRRDCPNR